MGFSRLAMPLGQYREWSYSCEIIYRLILQEGYSRIYRRFANYAIIFMSFAVTEASWKFGASILFDFHSVTKTGMGFNFTFLSADSFLRHLQSYQPTATVILKELNLLTLILLFWLISCAITLLISAKFYSPNLSII